MADKSDRHWCVIARNSTIRRMLLHLDYQQYSFEIEALPGETIATDGKVLR
ncbi:hypothetical protein [Nostoc sp.]|uniref:hypothetical protein n=1 Tax=Nostoc sp. TaxID=1180 RepID=UPI002FF7D933